MLDKLSISKTAGARCQRAHLREAAKSAIVALDWWYVLSAVMVYLLLLDLSFTLNPWMKHSKRVCFPIAAVVASGGAG